MAIAFILALFGLGLVYVEFFLPGGIMAVAGSLLLLMSVLMLAIGKYPLLLTIAYVILLLFLTYIVIQLALKQVKKRKNTIYLTQDQEGFVASSFIKEFIGKEGVVETPLRPSGNIVVEERLLQAVSTGEYIDRGKKIQVIGGEGARLIVRPKE